jgi:hypothetical protein
MNNYVFKNKKTGKIITPDEIPMPICKACGKTIDIKDGFKEIVNPITGEHEYYHKGCKSEWEKGSEFIKTKEGQKLLKEVRQNED